jgi:hypothetical protein
VEANAVGGVAGHADEDGIVQPVIGAVLRRLELRRRAEIETGRSLFVTTRRDLSAVNDLINIAILSGNSNYGQRTGEKQVYPVLLPIYLPAPFFTRSRLSICRA